MNQGRSQHAAVTLASGKVLVMGGNDGNLSLSSAESFDPATRAWTPAGSMVAGRAQHSAVLLADGTVLVAGGISGGNTGPPVSSSEIYDPVLSHSSIRADSPGISLAEVERLDQANWPGRT